MIAGAVDRCELFLRHPCHGIRAQGIYRMALLKWQILFRNRSIDFRRSDTKYPGTQVMLPDCLKDIEKEREVMEDRPPGIPPAFTDRALGCKMDDGIGGNLPYHCIYPG
jgi:hypothetical protein